MNERCVCAHVRSARSGHLGEYKTFLVGFLGKSHFDEALPIDEREGSDGAADREAEVIAYFLQKRIGLSPKLLATVTTDTCHGAKRSSGHIMELGTGSDAGTSVFIDHVLRPAQRVSGCKFHIGHLIGHDAVEEAKCQSVAWARDFLSWLRSTDFPNRLPMVFNITHCSTRFLSEVDEIEGLLNVRTFMQDLDHQSKYGGVHEKLRHAQTTTWLSLDVSFLQ